MLEGRLGSASGAVVVCWTSAGGVMGLGSLGLSRFLSRSLGRCFRVWSRWIGFGCGHFGGEKRSGCGVWCGDV
jgi:hypothetical protein